jgi:hypothetical protein
MQFYESTSKHVPAKFQLSSYYPDGLGQIFEIFPIFFLNFTGKLLSKFQKFQIRVCWFMTLQTKHVYAKFQLCSFNQDGLRQIFDNYPRKI